MRNRGKQREKDGVRMCIGEKTTGRTEKWKKYSEFSFSAGSAGAQATHSKLLREHTHQGQKWGRRREIIVCEK